jgi:hypothetical protein
MAYLVADEELAVHAAFCEKEKDLLIAAQTCLRLADARALLQRVNSHSSFHHNILAKNL